MMSANMIEAIKKDDFHDSKWVYRLLELFSEYYFIGLKSYESKKTDPLVWQYVYKKASDNKLYDIQHLLIGVNAHINYDLVLTLYDILLPEWHTLSQREQKLRYEDHCHVNDIIAATIDKVQDEILEPNEPFLDWVDKIFGRFDEYILSKIISSWRQEVWENSQKMLAISDKIEREKFRIKIENDVLKRANQICFFNKIYIPT